MKSIISASRRTDIPAFYLRGFMDAIRATEIIVPNPFYTKNIYRVDLRPESVEWIVFWSRNYRNFLQHKDYFKEYNLFFHFTIISHHRYLEKYNIKLPKAIRQVEELVSIYGPERLIWRYDPIVIWQERNKLETNFNIDDFTLLCEEFGAYGISRCYFSFVAPYKKFIKRFRDNYPKLKIKKVNSIEHCVTCVAFPWNDC